MQYMVTFRQRWMKYESLIRTVGTQDEQSGGGPSRRKNKPVVIASSGKEGICLSRGFCALSLPLSPLKCSFLRHLCHVRYPFFSDIPPRTDAMNGI